MSRAAMYRDNARKIRQLISGVNGAARADALSLADEYEAIAAELEANPITPRRPGYAQQIASLVEKHGNEIIKIRRREQEFTSRLAEAKHARLMLEAKVEGMLEVSQYLSDGAAEIESSPARV